MRTITIALLGLLLGAACDPCDSMRDFNRDECNAGNAEACEWLDNNVAPTGACLF